MRETRLKCCAILVAVGLIGVTTASDSAWAAGDVSVRVSQKGDLVIRGDRLDNRFFVDRVEIGTFSVRGLPDHDGAPTTIEGEAEITVSGVTGGIFIDAKQGDDHVEIDDVGATSGEVVILGGRGNDRVGFSNSVLSDNVAVNTGPGNDTVSAEDTTFHGDLVLMTGSGGDELSFSLVQVAGELDIEAGPGSDKTSLRRTEIGSVRVSMGTGNDNLEILTSLVQDAARIDGGSGNDSFVDDASTYGQLSVKRVEFQSDSP